ncbi:hypothetical protein FB567DRAFT_24043 [Paraphoma chrysanthemicola]|uniref:Uncharacterized protein n=1 Tax=Paraphoma chrysanthemicola TaxID=798071 RepID=A0A8K0RHR2_9PLEO|nr:hypothetical protein FB567DRAFT_24043 [Paraphoma chrysanthemicola]
MTLQRPEYSAIPYLNLRPFIFTSMQHSRIASQTMSGKGEAPEPVSQHEVDGGACEVSRAAAPQERHSPQLSLAAPSQDNTSGPNHTFLGLYAPHQEAGVIYFVVQELYRWTFQDRPQRNADTSEESSEPVIRVARVQYGTIVPQDPEAQRQREPYNIADFTWWKILRVFASLVIIGAACYIALVWYRFNLDDW